MVSSEKPIRSTRNIVRMSPKAAKLSTLLFTWGSLAFILVAGLMLLYVFQSDVIPYVGYFILAIVGTVTLFSLLTWAILREKAIKVAGRVPIVMWTCIVLAGGIAGMAVAGPKIAAETFSTSPYITNVIKLRHDIDKIGAKCM